MSLIDKFSMNLLNNDKKKSEENKNNILNVKYINRTGFANIINDLCDMGYNKESLSCLLENYKFNSVEEAINLISYNRIKKCYNHKFCKSNKKNICGICNDSKRKHEEYKFNRKNSRISEKNDFNSNRTLTKEDDIIIDTELKSLKKNNTLKSCNLERKKSKNSIKKKQDFVYGKIKISSETQKLFDDPNICPICYENFINKENVAPKCNHYFCDKCMKKYLTNKIINGDVLNIKCLLGGCQREYSPNDIKQNVSLNIYKKYKKFKYQKIVLSNPDKFFVQCPYPDCPEIVEITNFEEEFIKCNNNHNFCYKCRSLNFHRKFQCQIQDKRLLSELFHFNNQDNFKQCPKCNILIEKNNDNNEITCFNCGYKFCWLCLEECSNEHFNLYNFTGCPGMKNSEKINDNNCINCLWYFLSCVLAFLFVALIIVFYFLFGFSYELVKCYLKKNHHNKNYCIIILIIIAGLIGQPIYLIFYILYIISRIIMKFKCMFFCCFYSFGN